MRKRSVTITVADPEVGRLGVLDIQCRPNAKKKKKNTNSSWVLACFFFFAGLFHTVLYVRAHAHLSIMMGDRGHWMVRSSSKKKEGNVTVNSPS